MTPERRALSRSDQAESLVLLASLLARLPRQLLLLSCEELSLILIVEPTQEREEEFSSRK